MKNSAKVLLTLALTSTLALTTALGQTPPFLNGKINLDEAGSGTVSFTDSSGFNIVGYLNGSLGVDPVSGITTLCYDLSALHLTPVDGDIAMIEAPSQAISDLIRFAQGKLYFFSDREPNDPNPDLADVGIPPLGAVFVLNLLEVGPNGGPGPEGNNGALYVPLPGQPGFDSSGTWPGVTYNFISDVPEPTSLALLGLAGGFVLLRRRQHLRMQVF